MSKLTCMARLTYMDHLITKSTAIKILFFPQFQHKNILDFVRFHLCNPYVHRCSFISFPFKSMLLQEKHLFTTVVSYSCASRGPKASNNNNNNNNTNNDNNNNRIERCNSRFLQSPQCAKTLSNMYSQVARAQSYTNQVQHIKRLSCATCCVTCHNV